MPESNTQTNNRRSDADSQASLQVDVNLMHDIELNEKWICDIVCRILDDHDVTYAEISIAVVSDDQIQQLNKQYLEHDYETDVLSFNLSEAGTECLAGEIIVSADTATNTALENGVKPVHELALYVIHGVLHLVGHDDKESELRRKMRAAEKQYAKFFELQYCDPDGDSGYSAGES